jgi:2,3-bisphosphoglycerate-independent phosphoglycerate mutase
MKNKRVILIVRDGWGENSETRGNAIKTAKTPNHENYVSHYPTSLLKCIGREVGNPESAQGGSEVGHLTLGAGRIVWQPQELINQAIGNGDFFKNPALLSAIENCKTNNSPLHLAGLFSDAGVHSDVNHLYALLKLAKEQGLNKVFIHLVLDGRDVPEKSALGYLNKLEAKTKEIGVGKIASVAGRFYTMDRDTNWDRTKAGYLVMTKGVGFQASSAKEAIENAYQRGDKTDYYIQPTVMVENDKPVALIKNEDSFVWFNFRTDRSRQITAMMKKQEFCPPEFWGDVNPYFVGMCRYDESWTLPVAFEQQKVVNNLAEVLANHNKTQLRVAETEKYAHVTFFFNSQQEKQYPLEDRVMVPSPKVPSYDLQPEMSAPEVCEKVLENIGEYDFILVNFANPDLVGHSGVFETAVKACEVVDECVGKIVNQALENDYYVIVGADHGNAENMLYDNGEPDSSHGFNPVTYSLIGNDLDNVSFKSIGGLKDVAPTILELMGIEKPIEMTGESLIECD